ncbi:MAG: translocation/assembly module TamB domain-containing protein, partial [Bacteroidota bacterium]
GCFSGSIAGLPDLSTASASGTVTLQPSRIGDAEVEDGRVVFALQDGALDGSLEAQLASPFPDPGVAEGGRLDATFGGRPFDEVPSYDLQGTTDRLDVALLLDLPPEQPLRLTTAFDVAGRGTDPETMTLGGSVASRSSVVGPVALDTLRAQFGLASGVLRVDTLLVDSDLIDARGGGVLALFDVQAASDFGIEGEVESLAPLVAEGDGTLGLEQGTFVLRAESDPGAPLRIIGTSEARQFVYSQTAETLSGQTETVTYAVTGLNTALDASWDRAAADSLGLDAFDGEVRASFDQFSQRPEGGKPIQVRQGNARLRTDRGDLLVDGSVLVDDRRDLDLSARVDLETNGIELERGRFRIDDATWNLLQPAEITVDNGLIGIRGFLASTDRGTERVAVDGRIDFLGDQDLIVTVENLAIGGLTDFVNLEALGGDLSATLVLSGPAEAPLIDGTVVLDDLTSNGRRVGSLDADVTYADGSLRLDATLTHVDGEMLTVDGTVPLAFTLADGPAGGATSDASAEVSLVARADAFPIAWARPFLDDRAYNALGGTLRLDLRIEGTQAAPRLDGVATITDGRLGVVATGRTYEPILADLTFQNDRIVLDDVRILGRSGRTALDVDGEVRLRELSVGEFDLTITPNNFVAMDTRTYDGLVLDGARAPLRLTGTLDRPVLRGSVVLAEGDIYLTDELVPPELEAVTLTPEQIREVEARFGRVITARDTAVSQFVDALDYDLTVEIRRNVWLRSNQGLAFDVEFEGDVDARKRPFAESSRLFGRVDLVRGSVETLNRQFEVQRGTITFNGDPLAALVDLAAELEIRLPGSLAGQSSATITLGVDGRFNEDLAIRFSANPALEQADIVSLIATGRLADEAVSAGAAGGLALGAASGAFSNIVEGFASRNFGLELAQIDYEGGDLIVRVGDYVSNRLFWTAGFVTPIGDNTREQERLPILLTLDYQLLQWLSAQTEYSGRRGIGSGLNYEIAW